MHEIAIAEAIVVAVRDELGNRTGKRVTSVGMWIGQLTDVVPEALEFGFEAIVKSTPLEGVLLEIERVPARGACRTCGADGVLEPPILLCPQCHGYDVDITTGTELEIVHLDLEDIRSN